MGRVDDDNDELMELIKSRLEKGHKIYGQGVRTDDAYDWHVMALEEVLDGMVYIAAQIIRDRKTRSPK